MKRTILASGICPLTGEHQTITVSFREVRKIGMPPQFGYKKEQFNCDLSSDETIQTCEKCPIYIAATVEQ